MARGPIPDQPEAAHIAANFAAIANTGYTLKDFVRAERRYLESLPTAAEFLAAFSNQPLSSSAHPAHK
jgi:hypothetical protein